VAFGAALQDASSVCKSANSCGVAVSAAFRCRRHRLLAAATANKPCLPVLAADALLGSDASRAYAQIAREAGIHHEPTNRAAGEHVRSMREDFRLRPRLNVT